MSDVFEGSAVVDFQAKLPSITVDCDYYPAGTVLRLAVEVRVKGVGYDEDKEGNFVRQHKLGIQDIEVVSAFDPAEATDGVGGSLAGGAPAPGDTGIEVKTTADQWPSGVATTKDGKRVDTKTGEVLGDDPAAEPYDEAEADPSSVTDDAVVLAEEAEQGERARETADVGF